MKRNKFSLSHHKLLSMDMGLLIPVCWFDVLPGDTIQQSTSCLVRAAPLVSPVMHPLSIRIHHWYVPFRLIWSEFEDFITGGPAGTSLPVFPTALQAPAAVGSLGDHLGFPTGSFTAAAGSILPVRAYNKIWNENYRDEDLMGVQPISTASGNDTTTANALLPIAWEKDYFTSARPWEQKGPAVTVPLGSSAPVKGIGYSGTPASAGTNALFRETGGDRTYPIWVGTSGLGVAIDSTGSGATARPAMYADLSGASAASVNALRQAFAIQRFEEARARYGSRYTEYLRYLGVRSSDARLQRPEYLGGGKQVIQFSEVLQTAPSAAPDQANTVGAMKGHGIGAVRSNRYRRFIEEHGLIMTVISIRPKTIYMNGIHRALNKRLKEDYWQKELEHIGQQPVKLKEVYAAAASPEATFGYQDRYDEYRRHESSVSGEFRTILNYWHMARDLASEPALNSSFVTCVPTLRTFASAATDPFYVMTNHSIQARRMVAATGKSFIF